MSRYILILSALISIVSAQAQQHQDSLQHYYSLGMTAAKLNDNLTYRDAMAKADSIRPNHPTLIYHLARACALCEDHTCFEQALRNIYMLDAGFDLEEDSLLNAFTTKTTRQKMDLLSSTNNKVVANSSVYKKYNLGNFHPEGMAMDASKNIYLGGVHARAVEQINVSGDTSTLISYKKNPAIYAVMGVSLHENTLWFCTASLPEMLEYTDTLQGRSSVIAFNTKSRKIVKQEIIEGNHVFGDLFVDQSGRVFISDGAANAIYTTSLSDSLQLTYDLSEDIWNLQGITQGSDTSTIFLSDYISGLYRYNKDAHVLQHIKLPDQVSSKGFDGLYYYKNQLIGIQNGTKPKRSWLLTLNKAGNTIVKAQLIDQALKFLNEPTQGLIHDQSFYYIANSPWAFYENGELDNEKIEPLVILKYDLN